MEIETRDFGRIIVAEEDIVRFQSPIYGFEGLKDFVFLFEEGNGHIVWLQSAEDPQICFIMVDPAVVDKAYQPQVPREIRELLGEGEYLLWLIVVVAEEFQDSTVNMRSPVVVNPAAHRAAQVILDGDYPIRRPLTGGGKERP